MTRAGCLPSGLVVSAAALLAACAGPPWYMGSPRDGRPSIPSSTATSSPIVLAAEAHRERAACRQASELAALLRLDREGAQDGAVRARLAILLERRAAEWASLGRETRRAEDLRRLARLDPVRASRASRPPAHGTTSVALHDPGCAESSSDVVHAALAHTVVLRGLQGMRDDDLRVLADGPESRRVVALLLDEDPDSPDSLAMAALVLALAGRASASERHLTDMVAFSSDRDAAWERAAGVRERTGDPAGACRARIQRAYRDRDVASPAWQRAIACARETAGR